MSMAVKCLQVLGVGLLLVSMVAGRATDLGEGDFEVVLEDDDHVLLRYKRSAEVCKYKKGEFGECDLMTMLMTREDKLKSKNSPPQCEESRTITKNCKDKTQKKTQETVCVFEKPKSVPWSECKENGVKNRSLKLLKEKGVGCPKEKNLFKKCKVDKRNKKKNAKKEKCEFGGWSAWSTCKNNQQKRTREILKGAQLDKCMKKSKLSRKC